MKKASKLLASLICLALVFSVISAFSINSFAASSVNYSASSASGTQGGTVTVNVNVSGGTDIWGCFVKLSFDSSKLQYVSSAKGGKVASGSLNASGSSVTFAGNLNSCKSSGGTIFSVTFKILASSGSIPLTVSASGGADNIDSNGNNIPLTVSNGSITVAKPVTSISLDKTSVTLKKGETATITPSVAPADATNKTVTYSTSNSKVATVSGGKITAVGGGTATITATAGGKSATCTVNVKVTQTGIAVSGSKDKSVSEGATLKLSTAKVPADATDNYQTTWTSSDPSVATVSANGTVTGIKQGTVVITATSNGWKAVYNITITEKTSASESETESETVSEETTSEDTSTTEPISETSTVAENETVDDAKNASKFKQLYNKLFDKNNTVNKGYHYVMLITVGLVTVAICVPVTAIVTSNVVKNKGKKKDPESPDEK